MQKIHACPNDCILYRGEYENLDACPVCSALHYKIRKDDPGDVEGEHPRKRVPAKVMWYSPIIPCLKRLFRNKDNAKLMQWHKEERKQDSMLRHPADGSQWRKIDKGWLVPPPLICITKILETKKREGGREGERRSPAGFSSRRLQVTKILLRFTNRLCCNYFC